MPAADTYLTGAGVLAATVIRDGAGARVEGLQITTPLLRLTGAAQVQSGGATAQLDLTLTDLTRAMPGLVGALRFQGDVTAQDGDVVARGDLTLPGATAQVTWDQPTGAVPALFGQAQLPDLSA